MPIPLILAAASLCIASVHDGDTLRTCTGERVRLANIDAPELRGSPSCRRQKARTHWCDYKLGLRSRDALRAFMAGGAAKLHRTGTDRYGRTLARVTVNGRDAGEHLIGLGLARRWR